MCVCSLRGLQGAPWRATRWALILPLAVLIPLAAEAQSLNTHLTWQGDTSTTMTVAFENHDHVMKRTKRLRAGQPDPKGTLYLGDGCFGPTPRPGAQAGAAYLERVESKRHFWLVNIPAVLGVPAPLARFEAIDVAGTVFDSYEMPIKGSIVPVPLGWASLLILCVLVPLVTFLLRNRYFA